tara:strand:+ start:154 stop:678 length:525 start_codon:yes stop_codon:yes gene_type:complete
MDSIDINLTKISYHKSQKLPCSDIKYNNHKFIVKTPIMTIPFGLEKQYNDYILKLQFNGVKSNTDSKMVDFYNVICNIEKNHIEYLQNSDEYISQIKRMDDFDDLLIVKIKKKYNKIITNFKNNEDENISIFDLKKKMKVQCILELNQIWKTNTNKYVSKILVKDLIVYENAFD